MCDIVRIQPQKPTQPRNFNREPAGGDIITIRHDILYLNNVLDTSSSAVLPAVRIQLGH